MNIVLNKTEHTKSILALANKGLDLGEYLLLDSECDLLLSALLSPSDVFEQVGARPDTGKLRYDFLRGLEQSSFDSVNLSVAVFELIGVIISEFKKGQAQDLSIEIVTSISSSLDYFDYESFVNSLREIIIATTEDARDAEPSVREVNVALDEISKRLLDILEAI